MHLLDGLRAVRAMTGPPSLRPVGGTRIAVDTNAVVPCPDPEVHCEVRPHGPGDRTGARQPRACGLHGVRAWCVGARRAVAVDATHKARGDQGGAASSGCPETALGPVAARPGGLRIGGSRNAVGLRAAGLGAGARPRKPPREGGDPVNFTATARSREEDPMPNLLCLLLGHEPSMSLAIAFGFKHPVCERCGVSCCRPRPKT